MPDRDDLPVGRSYARISDPSTNNPSPPEPTGECVSSRSHEEPPDQAKPQDFEVEVCNDCGGLVGWEQIREGCCLGGVVCRRENGTRLLSSQHRGVELDDAIERALGELCGVYPQDEASIECLDAAERSLRSALARPRSSGEGR